MLVIYLVFFSKPVEKRTKTLLIDFVFLGVFDLFLKKACFGKSFVFCDMIDCRVYRGYLSTE